MLKIWLVDRGFSEKVINNGSGAKADRQIDCHGKLNHPVCRIFHSKIFNQRAFDKSIKNFLRLLHYLSINTFSA